MNNFFRYHQLWQLIVAYVKELVREPGVLFWGIIFPILMSLGLGVAFTKKPNLERTVAIVSSPQDPATELNKFLNNKARKIKDKNESGIYELEISDENLGKTTIDFKMISWDEAIASLKKGNLSLIMDEKKGQIQYHFDPSNPDAQLVYMKISKLLSNKQSDLPGSDETIEPLTVSGSRYIDFLIPGLISMGVMMSCMWGLGYGIIDKRSKKLMRRMVATPMKKSHFLFSLITVRIGMNFIESALLFLFAWIVFDVTIQGNIPALLVIFITGNLAFSGLAVFISSRTANTEVGNGLINAIVFPLMVLSGVFFSYHNFPDWSIPYIQKLPLTLLADGVRSIFIEGAGFSTVLLPITILLIIGFIFFMAALRIFKWY